MRQFLSLLGIIFLTTAAMAQDAQDGFLFTARFDLEGGRFKTWKMTDYLNRTDNTPVEIRFVITGIDIDPKWGSDIGFFFQPGSGREGNAGSKKNRPDEIRLRFMRDTKRRRTGSNIGPRSKTVLTPELSVRPGRGERHLSTLDMEIGLNEPVTLLIRKDGQGNFRLAINGRGVPMAIDGTLTSLGVHFSGIKGEISMPPF